MFPVAPKSSRRRCPSCGSPVHQTQKFCSECGNALAPAGPVRKPGRFQTLLGKAVIALFVLVLLIGLANRMIAPDDEASPTRQPDLASNIDPPPTRTVRPATRTLVPPTDTSVPPSRTSAPPTSTREPAAANTPAPTNTPNSAPAEPSSPTPPPATSTQPVSQSDTPIRQRISTREPAPTRTPQPQPTDPPPSPAEAPSNTPVPPTATSIPPSPTISGLALAATDCAGYDAWEWAQSVYETDPVAFAGLDADGDGTACPTLPSGGFAPAFWTSNLPSGLAQGTLDAIIDGDTFEITVDGQTSRYRLYRADTPEVGETMQCGGTNATDFVRFVLAFNDTPGQIWIEDVGQRDPFGRKLAYLWFTVAGEPYLLNHVLINNGWAENIDYGDDFDPYPTQLGTAASFAQAHRLGVWSQCGGFGVLLPSPTPFPTQAPLPTDAPFVPPTQAPMNLGGDGCDPNYRPCVPLVNYDLDCDDIRMQVQVIGSDPHGFDGSDNDGRGCESW